MKCVLDAASIDTSINQMPKEKRVPYRKRFQCIDSKWINPLTQQPFRWNEEFEGKFFVRHLSTGPVFASSSPRHAAKMARKLLNSAQARARKHGGIVTITIERILDAINTGCELTGIPFDLSKTSKKRPSAYAPSLDRIDCSNRNYTPENTRVVLAYVNAALNNFPLESSFEILKALLETLKKEWSAAQVNSPKQVEVPAEQPPPLLLCSNGTPKPEQRSTEGALPLLTAGSPTGC